MEEAIELNDIGMIKEHLNLKFPDELVENILFLDDVLGYLLHSTHEAGELVLYEEDGTELTASYFLANPEVGQLKRLGALLHRVLTTLRVQAIDRLFRILNRVEC